MSADLKMYIAMYNTEGASFSSEKKYICTRRTSPESAICVQNRIACPAPAQRRPGLGRYSNCVTYSPA